MHLDDDEVDGGDGTGNARQNRPDLRPGVIPRRPPNAHDLPDDDADVGQNGEDKHECQLRHAARSHYEPGKQRGEHEAADDADDGAIDPVAFRQRQITPPMPHKIGGICGCDF